MKKSEKVEGTVKGTMEILTTATNTEEFLKLLLTKINQYDLF